MFNHSRVNSAPRLRSASGLAAAGVALVAGLALSACGSTSGSGSTPGSKAASQGPSSSAPGSSSSAPSTTAAPPKPKKVVKVTTLNSDGVTYGVGMPVITFFSKKITSAKAWQAGTKATVNGKPVQVAWYFESSDAGHGPIEAHLRPEKYWPAHSHVHVTFPAKGTALGGDFVSDGALNSLDFNTGKANISVVNDATHQMTVTSDGKLYGKFPVSLGASNTPTAHGTKVIMEKGLSICMHGPGYDECGIKDTQRLTYGGEYLHAAPWNVSNINNGVDSSNGCTNLLPSDADQLYHFLHVGDVVTYPNANGPQMSLGAGYGDWNVDWASWQTGGLVSTTS